MRFVRFFTFAVLSVAISACGEKQDYAAPIAASGQEASGDTPTDNNSAAGTTSFNFYDFADYQPGKDFDRVEINKLDFLTLGSRNYYLVTSTIYLNGHIVACDFHYSNTGNSAPTDILDFEATFAAVNSDPSLREGSSKNEVRTNPDRCNEYVDQALSNIRGKGATFKRTDETALIKARWNNTGI